MESVRGYTLLEFIVVMSLMSIMTGMAVINLRQFNVPATNAAHDVSAFIKRARAYAMSSTSTIKVAPLTSDRIQATTAQACSDSLRSTVQELDYNLPNGATLTSTNWSICFTSRGISQESLEISIHDNSSTRTVQIVLGGGVRVL